MAENKTAEGKQIPSVVFKTRVKGEGGEYDWKDVKSEELFSGKKVVLFALPGAFTPTCSSVHLPGYEAVYDDIKALGVDEVYCLSVNDAFVMNEWGKAQNVKNVKLIPDGNGDFARGMGMLVKKDNVGFGERSWRYSMYVEDGVVKKMFIEEGFSDNFEDDPFEVSDAQTMMGYLKGK